MRYNSILCPLLPRLAMEFITEKGYPFTEELQKVSQMLSHPKLGFLTPTEA